MFVWTLLAAVARLTGKLDKGDFVGRLSQQGSLPRAFAWLISEIDEAAP
jgi:hypothetical protein